MIFHDLGVPKTHPKSIPKSRSTTARFLDSLRPHFGSLWASRWLQHGLQSSQDGSKTAQGASKTPLIRRQDRPESSKNASRTVSRAPRRRLRLSKGLQVGSGSFQDAKSSPEGLPSLQLLSTRTFRHTAQATLTSAQTGSGY